MELIETVGQPEAEVLPTLTEAVVTWGREYGDLFPALAPMTEQSETLMAAVNLRTVAWRTISPTRCESGIRNSTRRTPRCGVPRRWP
jgi:hypothetical protein